MDLIRKYRLGSSYCGINASQVAQDYFLWEMLLNDYAVDGIIELGTAYGGFSLFLLHQARARELAFVTFDSVNHETDEIQALFGRPNQRQPTGHHLLGPHFQQADVLNHTSAVREALRYIKRPVLFCDNGDKKREVALYGPRLPSRSILVVHDWLTEIGPDDIPDEFEVLYEDLCNEIESWSRMFIKI